MQRDNQLPQQQLVFKLLSLKTSPTGASQYSENHFVITDAYGLFNVVIGAGAVQSGSMANNRLEQ
jgi:hypothetical protein